MTVKTQLATVKMKAGIVRGAIADCKGNRHFHELANSGVSDNELVEFFDALKDRVTELRVAMRALDPL